MCWSWRQTCGKLSKQNRAAVLVGHCVRLCFAPACCAASCENSVSWLAPDSSRFALPLAHRFIANPLEKFISSSTFHLWCGVLPSPTNGIQMHCFSSDPVYRWPSPPGLLGFSMEKGSLEGPEQAMHLFHFGRGRNKLSAERLTLC